VGAESHVLTACIQATSLQGAQGVLWWVVMSLRARCFFFPTQPAPIISGPHRDARSADCHSPVTGSTHRVPVLGRLTL